MANVQLPVLFQISDATGATLFGEEVSVDVIENNLKLNNHDQLTMMCLL